MYELRYDGRRWWCLGAANVSTDCPHASQALDWLWQRLNNNTHSYFSVIKLDVGRCIAIDPVLDGSKGGTLLFTGTPKEIVQQLGGYLQMMEGA